MRRRYRMVIVFLVLGLGALAAAVAWLALVALPQELDDRRAAHAAVHAAADRAAAAAAESDWIVLSRQGLIVRAVGQTRIIEACITYTSPGGTQEDCRDLRIGAGEMSTRQRESARCWEQARIGEPLPDYWR